MNTRQSSGKTAKSVGHQQEQVMCKYLSEVFGGEYTTDGGNRTKVDIKRLDRNINYSLKSVSGKSTQVHLTSVSRWCEYFSIEGYLRKWFDMFFGVPHEDISNGDHKQHRIPSSLIDSDLNDYAIQWFNENRMDIFNVIVRRGMSGDCVDYVIWNKKKSGEITIHDVNDLSKMVYNGEWILNDTTLFFVSNGVKLFHLQMKGSGTKYNSGYHSLMFHIHL